MMVPPYNPFHVSEHFRERVLERIPGENPWTLWQGILWAISNARTDLVEYVGRQASRGKKGGARKFRFRSARINAFCIIVCNLDEGVPITVMLENEVEQ